MDKEWNLFYSIEDPAPTVDLAVASIAEWIEYRKELLAIDTSISDVCAISRMFSPN